MANIIQRNPWIMPAVLVPGILVAWFVLGFTAGTINGLNFTAWVLGGLLIAFSYVLGGHARSQKERSSSADLP